ncbi:hypothetical protein ABZ619_10250 [Streptomyces sp. NPDC007851]|uniref:hypothetical protein n=1 Tax=Streptomyces sp. NPDC007851 TaxID=3155008 RepID=UPI0033F0B325
MTEALCAQAGFSVWAGLGVALVPCPHAAAPTGGPSYLQVTDVAAARHLGTDWLTPRTLPPNSTRFLDHVRAHPEAVAEQEILA